MRNSRVVIVLLAFISCGLVQSDEVGLEQDEDYFTQAMRALVENCRTPETTDDDVSAILNSEKDMSYAAKCVMACITKQFGMFTEDRKFNVEVATVLFDGMSEDKEERKMRHEVIEKCKHVEDEDECEMAYKLNMCVEEANKGFGLKY